MASTGRAGRGVPGGGIDRKGGQGSGNIARARHGQERQSSPATRAATFQVRRRLGSNEPGKVGAAGL
jgi:hypothetical protein